MEKIRMSFCNGGKVSKEKIQFVEETIGKKLPHLFYTLVKNCDAGSPQKNDLVFFDTLLNSWDHNVIGAFLSLKEDYPYEGEQIIGFFRNPSEGFPDGLIAFAVDPFGNYFCFDYREGKDNPNPPIVFWNHEGAGTEEAVSFLAKDFEGFLKMLKSEEEADREYEELKKQQEDTSK